MKANFKRTAKSFREYVLISQDKLLVEVFFKPKGKDFWQYRPYDSLEDVLLLQTISSKIPMSEIYRDWSMEE